MSDDWFPFGPSASTTRACKSSPLVVVYLVCSTLAVDSRLVIALLPRVTMDLVAMVLFTRRSKPQVEIGCILLLPKSDVHNRSGLMESRSEQSSPGNNSYCRQENVPALRVSWRLKS